MRSTRSAAEAATLPQTGIRSMRRAMVKPPQPDVLSRAVAKVGVIRGAGALLHEGWVSQA